MHLKCLESREIEKFPYWHAGRGLRTHRVQQLRKRWSLYYLSINDIASVSLDTLSACLQKFCPLCTTICLPTTPQKPRTVLMRKSTYLLGRMRSCETNSCALPISLFWRCSVALTPHPLMVGALLRCCCCCSCK